MYIDSKEFGEFEADTKDILCFKTGLYGFENVHNYVLMNLDDQGYLMCLHPTTENVPSFIVVDPTAIINEYHPVLSQSDLDDLDAKQENDLKYIVIAVVKENYRDTVVNLKSPIAINPANNQAKQVITENTDYPIRYRIFSDDKEEAPC